MGENYNVLLPKQATVSVSETKGIRKEEKQDQVIYVPVLRSRQQEDLVLKSFDFGKQMYPLIEILKEHDRVRKKQKDFKDIYSSLISKVNADKIFIDLPLYLSPKRNTKKEILEFDRKVLSNPSKRIEYLLSLKDLSDKMIPVVWSYYTKNGRHSLTSQVSELRNQFSTLAFRISITKNFEIIWDKIAEIAEKNDYIIIDFDTVSASNLTEEIEWKIKKIKEFNNCSTIMLRSSINTDVQNVGLKNGEIVKLIDNSLLEIYSEKLGGTGFGDYAGVKKDEMTKGGGISPGFIFFDPTMNHFLGFKGKEKKLSEFENTIVPEVIKSSATSNMDDKDINYLNANNKGWFTLNNIKNKNESGQSQAKFKKIAIEHYLHCTKAMINNGAIS